jgi:hypothetical protein
MEENKVVKVETPEEKKAKLDKYRKDYYLAHKDKIKEYQVKYRLEHPPEPKPPRIKSTLTPKQRMIDYRAKLGPKYNEFRNELLTCPTCLVQYKRYQKWTHDKTANHIKSVADQTIKQNEIQKLNDKIKSLEIDISNIKSTMV